MTIQEVFGSYLTRLGHFPTNKEGVKRLKSQGLYMDFVALRARVTGIFGVRNFADIHQITQDPNAIARTKFEYDERFSLQYPEFSADTQKERMERYKKYSDVADSVIDQLSEDFLGHAKIQTDLTNELRTIHHPVELLAIVFNPAENETVRFETYRKLMLMEYAQDVDVAAQRFPRNIDEVNYFLIKTLLNDDKKGPQKTIFIASMHDPNTLACTSYVKFDSRQEANNYRQDHLSTKVTGLPLRELKSGKGIFISTRKKSDVAQVVKLLRKNSHEATGAIPDVFGILCVVETYQDVRKIVEELIKGAQLSGSEIQIANIEDNIKTGEYSVKNGGSSKDFRSCKLVANFHGLRVEMIIHTIETHLDSLYRHDVSHDEFEVKRVFETGIIERLFPPKIYDLDPDVLYRQAIMRARSKAENS